MSNPDITTPSKLPGKSKWEATAVLPNDENVKGFAENCEVIYIHQRGALMRRVSFS